MPACLFWCSVTKTVYRPVSYSNTYAYNLAVVPSIYSLHLRRSISIWSLTSDLAHCFLKLVLSNVPAAVIQLQVRTYKYKYKRGYTRAKASRRLLWSHTQLGYIWYYENTQGGSPYSITCYRYLLIWYCHLVQKMSPPYINL